jgi:hypothetical protein
MASSHNIQIVQGETFQLNITWKDGNDNPINLTSYSARMDVRPYWGSSERILTSQGLSPNITLTLGGASGTIDVSIDAVTTAALAAPANGVYDIEVQSGAFVKKLLRGNVRITDEATR